MVYSMIIARFNFLVNREKSVTQLATILMLNVRKKLSDKNEKNKDS